MKKLYYEQAALPPTRTIDSFDEDAVLTEVCQKKRIFIYFTLATQSEKNEILGSRIPGLFRPKLGNFRQNEEILGKVTPEY